MNVLEKNTRHDFRKLFDPKSTALDVAKSIDLAFWARNIESLVERSVMKAVKDVGRQGTRGSWRCQDGRQSERGKTAEQVIRLRAVPPPIAAFFKGA